MSASTAAKIPGTPPVEPSMEEILASIRRIIADDNLGTKKDEAPAPIAEVVLPPAPEKEEDLDADVLDLADVATVAAQPQSVDIPDDVKPEGMASPSFEGVMDEAEAEFEPAPVAALPLAPMPVRVSAPPVTSVAGLEGRILSDNTGTVVSEAFQTLARHTPMPAMGRSLEDVVVEMLRPMLRGWLDENLPAIVEKLVKAEIERIARGS